MLVIIREARGPTIESPIIYNTDDGFAICDQEGEFGFNLPDERCTGPLVMCVHVSFNAKEGEVLFAGAGGWFEEWT